MMKLRYNNKGVSLALTIGLLLLLVTIVTTINELVIRSLRASHQIEAADKAYLAAEAGVEDALYELSAHNAGYRTPALTDTGNVRSARFDDDLIWQNNWEIESRNPNTCDDMDPWLPITFNPRLCGRIYENEKVVINLFNDDAYAPGLAVDRIGTGSADISTLDFLEFTIYFRLPRTVAAANLSAFVAPNFLKIDNDGDYLPGVGGLNEDGAVEFGYPLNTCPYSGGILVKDNDCDTLEDEDSPEDPVFLWKLIDDEGHSFQPLRGCLNDPATFAGYANSTLCEKNFQQSSDQIFVSLTQDYFGIDDNGTIVSLATFINSVLSVNSKSPLQLEILPVIPFQFVNETAQEKIRFPYFEYGIQYTEISGRILPTPHFSIKSDGYYQSFKQSITTNVLPQATTRLLDLTIIQQ